jgi:hypothetical protein
LIKQKKPTAEPWAFSKVKLWVMRSESVAAISTAAAATAETTPATTTAVAATATAVATTTTPATATAEVAARAVFTGLGFVDGQGSALVLLPVEGGNRCLGFFVAGHFDESETFAAAGVPIADDLGAFDSAVSAKQLLKGRAIDVVAQISHI